MTQFLNYKILFCLGFILISFQLKGYSQYHYKGEKAFELAWGKSDIGYLFKGAYSKYFKDNWYFKGLLFYESGRPFQTNYHNLGFQGLACYSPFNINYDAFFNVVGGVAINYESLLNLDLAAKSSTNFGLVYGLEGEFFVNEQVAFIAGAYQNTLFNKKFGNERWDFTIGLKFLIH